jgi:hypothetical protein
MRRIALLCLAAIALVSMDVMAQQEFPRAEVFGGYSYFRANPEEINLNGWNASITGNLTDYFGIEADFSGHYKSLSRNVDINSHTFMAGPKLAYRMEGIVPFAHFLIGASRSGTNSFGFGFSDYALASAIGGGVDLKINKRFAIRAAQADYLMTRFNDERQNNFRFSAGIVIRLDNR